MNSARITFNASKSGKDRYKLTDTQEWYDDSIELDIELIKINEIAHVQDGICDARRRAVSDADGEGVVGVRRSLEAAQLHDPDAENPAR